VDSEAGGVALAQQPSFCFLRLSCCCLAVVLLTIEALRAMRWLALKVIRFYQTAISPWTPPSCIYSPTCSQYGYEAISKYGLLKGGWLALRRILRCHPWGPGGHDPVP
jgi:hypothetical protein